MIKILEYKRTLHISCAVLTFMALLTCLAMTMDLLYTLPFTDTLRWYAGAFILLYIPGNLLLRWLRFESDEFFTGFFYSLALGTALMPLPYALFRKLSYPDGMYLLGIAALLLWLLLCIQDVKTKKPSKHTTYHEILSILFLYSFVVILLHLSHFTNVVLLDDGYQFRNNKFTDTVFHLGLINNLKHFYPPFFPYANGHSFAQYHLNMHLEIEMFHRFFSIDTLKLTFFYAPLLYLSLLVIIPYHLVSRLSGSKRIGILTATLVFGSDLSFIPGFIGLVPADYPWNIIFSTTIWSLFTLNGYLPALLVMFLFLINFKMYLDTERTAYLFISGLLGYAAYGFKSSMGPHIMAAAFLTGLIMFFGSVRKKHGARICGVSFIAISVMFTDMMLLRGGTGYNIITWYPFNGFALTLSKLHLSEVSQFWYCILFPIYIIATLGVRLLGFFFIKNLRTTKYFDPLSIFLMLFIIVGMLFYEMLYIGPPTMDLNNAAWFSAQALMGGWLILSYFLAWTKDNKMRRLLVFAFVILFAFPSTVQFLKLRFDKSYFTISSLALEVKTLLETTPPESVILHPFELNGPSLASHLTGRQTVITVFRAFVTDAIGFKEGSERVRDVQSFFSLPEAAVTIDRIALLRKYGVDYIYAPFSSGITFNKYPLIEEIFRNKEYIVFKVAHNAIR